MHSIQIKNKVLKLRKSGKSIYEIGKVLGLKTATVSTWCKNLLLTEEQRNKIHQNGRLKAREGMLVYTEKLRQQRLQRILLNKKAGARIIGRMSVRDLLMIGFGLYWGEGYKYENCELGFTKSNLNMIKFYIKWLNQFNVSKENLIFKLTINEVFRKHENIIKQTWIRALGINGSQFSATTFIRTNLKKADISNLKTYSGILRVKVRRGRELRNKIIGALEHINSCS